MVLYVVYVVYVVVHVVWWLSCVPLVYVMLILSLPPPPAFNILSSFPSIFRLLRLLFARFAPASLGATMPLLYELAAEISFPSSEGISGQWLCVCGCVCVRRCVDVCVCAILFHQ